MKLKYVTKRECRIAKFEKKIVCCNVLNDTIHVLKEAGQQIRENCGKIELEMKVE